MLLTIIIQAALSLQPEAATMAKSPDREVSLNIVFDKRFFSEADSDKDGLLSRNEFMRQMDRQIDAFLKENPRAAEKMNSTKREEIRAGMIKPTFLGLDKNNDGFLQFKEASASVQTN